MKKTDIQLKHDVEAELSWDPKVNAARIGISVTHGALSLMGEVDSYAEKWAAEAAAKRVAGVRSFAEELTVKVLCSHEHADVEIAQAALNAFEWDVWVPPTVTVRVEKGRLCLEGKVEWKYQHDAAENAVRNLAGVISVFNDIVVAPRASASEVKEKVQAALLRQASKDATTIEVDTAGGTVTLTGNASSWHAIEDAAAAAWSAPGVTEVVDNVAMNGF